MPDTVQDPAPPANDRVSTPLLTLITQQSLDEDYRQVAERRATHPGVKRRATGISALVVAVFGLLATVAALQTQEGEDVRSASRNSLIAQIDEGRTNLSQLQREIVKLRELGVGLQTRRDRVTSDELAAQARLQRLAATTGFGPVTGPGVRITVDDNPDGSLVRDRDLRLAVNGLWEVGAEAIAVNGNRLTARSAIRNSGIAIRVNNRSLSPPYVITAIGNEKTLQADLMQTTSGLIFRNTLEEVGFPWTMDNVHQLVLPAAPLRVARLRSAVAGTAEQIENQHRKEAPQ